MIDFEKFILEPVEINFILKLLNESVHPTSLKELAEEVIRRRLEGLAAAKNRRVYSPEQKYSVGEKIFFYMQDDEIKFAEIISIEHSNGHSLYGNYDRIIVSIEGQTYEKVYVSKCPKLPLRYSFSNERKDFEDEDPKTPGQIFMQQENKIRPVIFDILSKIEELTHVNDDWFIKEKLPKIRDDEIIDCYNFIKISGHPLTADKLTSIILKFSPESPRFPLFRFSLINCLQHDEKFIQQIYMDELGWDIKKVLPPSHMTVSLSLDAISSGYFKITRGIKHLLEYCGITNEVILESYGGYEVKGYIDRNLRRVYSQDIAQWFKENRLGQGDKIRIKSPPSPSEHPVIYTVFEHRNEIKKGGKTEGKGNRNVNLRHLIYSLLKSRQEYTHTRIITEEINKVIEHPVNQSTISGILSGNEHIFIRMPKVRGLWGLSEWEGKITEVDKISLSLSIEEEDWVIKVLEAEDMPMTVNELAERLSVAFIVRKEKILEITFLNPTDNRLIEIDGKWGLRIWIEKWEKSVEDIDKELERRRKLNDFIPVLNKRKEELLLKLADIQNHKRLLREQIVKVIKYHDTAVKKKSLQTKKRINMEERLISTRKKLEKKSHINWLLILFVMVIISLGEFLVEKKEVYKSLGLPHYLLIIMGLIYVAVRSIIIHRQCRDLQNECGTIENNIRRLNENCRLIDDSISKAKSKFDIYKKRHEVVKKNIKIINEGLSNINDKYQSTISRMEAIDVNALTIECDRLNKLILTGDV